MKLNCGRGTNAKEQLLSLWCLCKVALTFGLDAINIFGNSQVILNWAKDIGSIHVLNIAIWCKRTKHLLSCFNSLEINHTYRKNDGVADQLSKGDLLSEEGILLWEEYIENHLECSDSWNIFWT